MKKIILLAYILFVVDASAQVMGNSQYNNGFSNQFASDVSASRATIVNNNEILIKTDGLMNIVADNYVAVFNLVQVGETLAETDRLIDERINNFKHNLQQNGIEEGAINIDLVSFVPRYDMQTESKLFSKSYNEIPAGYEIQKNILVFYNQSDKIDKIMSSALKSEVYDLVKVDYYINNINLIRDSLRNVCLADVEKKVKSYEQIGVKLNMLDKNISDNFITVYPQTRYNSYKAFTAPSLSVAKRKQVSNEIPKVASRFYNPQDYSMYDIVINPLITQPVVQLSYSIVVKYIRKEEKVLHILTPTGQITEFYQK